MGDYAATREAGAGSSPGAGTYAATREAGAGLSSAGSAPAAATVDPRQRPGADLTKIDPSKLGQQPAFCGTGEWGEAVVGAGQTVTKSQNQVPPLHLACPVQTQQTTITPMPLGNGVVVGVRTNVPGLNFSESGSGAGSGPQEVADDLLQRGRLVHEVLAEDERASERRNVAIIRVFLRKLNLSIDLVAGSGRGLTGEQEIAAESLGLTVIPTRRGVGTHAEPRFLHEIKLLKEVGYDPQPIAGASVKPVCPTCRPKIEGAIETAGGTIAGGTMTSDWTFIW